MNSTISDDLNREHLALEAAKCLKNIFANTQNLNTLHKELLEINLSIRAYIEESTSRLNVLRLDLANEAKSSHEVNNMSNLTTTPHNDAQNIKIRRKNIKTLNDTIKHGLKHDSPKNFITWYKHMIDYERQNLSLYMSESVTLEWFGRTIRTRKKVSAFLNYDVECTRHDFRSIESIEKIQSRQERDKSPKSTVLATPLDHEMKNSTNKRKLKSDSNSPEWAQTPQSVDIEFISYKRKRLKTSHIEAMAVDEENKLSITSNNDKNDLSNKGDGSFGHRPKRTSITPTNVECGQGDCLPSTSGTDSDRSHDTLNSQLPKLAVECNGYIEFTRSRNNHSIDSVKWNRKCKVQISYSEDCLNPGEYIIWALCYNDGSKCRRNLLAAFEDASQDEDI